VAWRIVTTDFPPQDGGIATWCVGLARALGRVGEAVVVHARAASGVRARPPSPTEPYEILPMQGRSWASWQAVWAAASVLPRLRRGDRLISATWPLAVHLVGPAARLGVPVGVLFHGSDVTRPPQIRGFEAVRDAGVALLPVSHFLGGLLGAPYTVVPSPIDLAPVAEPGEDLLVIARLGALKGVDRAIRLAGRLGRRVRVVGDGPERAKLERLAAELGVEAQFYGRLTPEAMEAEGVWRGVWALALFSRPAEDGSGAEGLGLVVLEAAARGIPTLGSRVGGIPEVASVVLDDPEHDPLPPLPPRDEVRAWVEERHGSAAMLRVVRAALDGAPPLGGDEARRIG